MSSCFLYFFHPWICILTPFCRSRPDLRGACGKQLLFALQIHGLLWHWADDPSYGLMGFHIINFLWLRSTGTHIRLSCISVFDQMNGRLNCFYHIASWIRMKSSFQGPELVCACLREGKLFDVISFLVHLCWYTKFRLWKDERKFYNLAIVGLPFSSQFLSNSTCG